MAPLATCPAPYTHIPYVDACLNSLSCGRGREVDVARGLRKRGVRRQDLGIFGCRLALKTSSAENYV